MVKTVIGLTGAFGSGCSTAAKFLRDKRKFNHVRLSEPIRKAWALASGKKGKAKKNSKKGSQGPQASRRDLQRLGDEMREEQGASALVDLAIPTTSTSEMIVVETIRNPEEARRLRQRFGDSFVLVAVVSSLDARWDRIGTAYTDVGEDRAEFLEDDLRDKDEETPTGQRVQLCIDLADVVIDNSETVTLAEFKTKVLDFVDLLSRKSPRPPSTEEILMNMAYASSHSSLCVKRHVGAVVVRDQQVVGAGYNENPIGTKPCVKDEAYQNKCYRDVLRNDRFDSLAKRGILCPVCGKSLPTIVGPPWNCPDCKAAKIKTNLEDFFFPDRAMNWCTAVHAEVWAIFAAGDRARGADLYTTTFPCFQCCEKIAQAGIKTIVYTEAYPDALGQDRLDKAKIAVKRFEGVRSSSFERIFRND